MALPELSKYGLLPPGDHAATTADIFKRFGWNDRRVELFQSAIDVAHSELWAIGFDGDYYVDGSFITAKDHPGDIDLIVDAYGADPDVFSDCARCIISRYAEWYQGFGLDVHIRHPRIAKDISILFRRVSEEYQALRGVPPGVQKGLVRWLP